MSTKLSESLAKERNPDVPESDLTIAGRIRRALFMGERLQPRTAAARFGGSNGLLGQVAYQLEQIGFVIDRTPAEDGFVAYHLENPDYVPTEAHLARAREKVSKSKSKKKAAKALARVEVEPPPRAPHPAQVDEDAGGLPVALPDLGQSLRVYALVQNDDESITIGLRNGTRKWTANLSGVIDA